MADERIRIANQDLYLDGRWVAHIAQSGKHFYGALPGQFFRGGSFLEIARQIMVAIDAEVDADVESGPSLSDEAG